MASSVTAPLERQFGQMPGLNQMTSTSSSGSSVITLQFVLDARASTWPSRKCRRRSTRPVHAICRPICRSRPSTARSIRPTRRSSRWRSRRRRCRCRRWRTSPTRGWRRRSRSCRAWASSASAAARSRPCACRPTRPRWPRYGLTLEDLRTAIGAANVNQAKGSFDGPRQAYMIGANDQLLTSRDYRPLVVAYRNGAPVRRRDVADGDRRRRERAAGRVDERDTGGDPEHPAPAGRQHHRRRRPDQGAAAPAAGHAARVGAGRRSSPTARPRSARRCRTCSSS